MTANLNISSRLKDDQLKFKIGQRLKELRTAQGLTIDALREKLSLEVQKAGLDVKGDGVSKSMVSRWENGKSQPSAPYIRAYATLFNVLLNLMIKYMIMLKMTKTQMKHAVKWPPDYKNYSIPGYLPSQAIKIPFLLKLIRTHSRNL